MNMNELENTTVEKPTMFDILLNIGCVLSLALFAFATFFYIWAITGGLRDYLTLIYSVLYRYLQVTN